MNRPADKKKKKKKKKKKAEATCRIRDQQPDDPCLGVVPHRPCHARRPRSVATRRLWVPRTVPWPVTSALEALRTPVGLGVCIHCDSGSS
jgi:hypothetical protein